MRTGRPSKFKGFDCEDFQNYLKKNSRVDENGCWIWGGAVAKNGYGKIKVYQVTQAPHRLSFKVFVNFEIKTEDFVCHKCDVKLCINPDHLFLGDNSANQVDFFIKKNGIVKPLGERLRTRIYHKKSLHRNEPVETVKSFILKFKFK